MGLVRALLWMGAVLLLVLIVGQWNKEVAFRLLETSHILFEPEPEVGDVRRSAATMRRGNKRGYISPYSKKLVASRQHWKCAICGRILDASYEIDHITELSRGGTDDMSNLRALHRSCHILRHTEEAGR